jgi:hypothetical protein
MASETSTAFPYENVVLLTAAVALVTKSIGVRTLAIKGVASAEYGLRPPRPSSDVDVLVDPERFDDVIETFGTRGWISRASDPDTATFPLHSVSLFHPNWNIDVDIHFRYPGIELAPAEAFEQLWRQRTTLWCGSQPVQIPSLSDAVIVSALHALRGLWIERHSTELDILVARCSAIDTEYLIERAGQLGALATARPFLERVLRPSHAVTWGEPSEEWALRTRIPEPMARRAVHWRRAGWRERIRLARLALFPPAAALRKETTITRLGPSSALRAYLRRWLRGIVAIPRVLPVLLGRADGTHGTSTTNAELPPESH